MVLIHKKDTESQKEEKKKLAEQAKQGIQDEFQAKGFELISFVQGHKGLITSLILAFFLIGGLVSAYFYMQQRKEEEASSAFFEAVTFMDTALAKADDNEEKADYAEAIEKLKNVTRDFPKTKIATLAYLYLGKLFLDDKKSSDAVDAYQKAVEKLDTKNKLYIVGVIGLAYALESNDQPEIALTNLEQLINSDKKMITDLALWEAARMAKKTNNLEKAKELADRLLDEFPFSIYKTNAEMIKNLN